MMDYEALSHAVEAILFASGEPVKLSRLAGLLAAPEDDVAEAARRLADQLAFERRGIRVVRLEDSLQMCTAAEQAELVAASLETRKPPRLSAAALETLTIIAYYQPATRAYVDQIRGVDSSYSVGALLTKGLIEECGRLNVPGRPILYQTTPDFLRTFGLESLAELPEIEKIKFGKPQLPPEGQDAAQPAAVPDAAPAAPTA